MASAKLVWFVLDIFGGSIWLLGIVANSDNWKSLVLFALGCIYGAARIYYYIVQREQAKEEKELEIWHKRMDKEERVNGKK